MSFTLAEYVLIVGVYGNGIKLFYFAEFPNLSLSVSYIKLKCMCRFVSLCEFQP